MKYEKSSVKYVYIYISGVHVQSMTGASRNVLMAVNKKKMKQTSRRSILEKKRLRRVTKA